VRACVRICVWAHVRVCLQRENERDTENTYVRERVSELEGDRNRGRKRERKTEPERERQGKKPDTHTHREQQRHPPYSSYEASYPYQTPFAESLD